jgi:putative endonuclease
MILNNMPQFTVYVIESTETDYYYIGQTNDLSRRVSRHNENNVTSTKGRGPFEIVYTEAYDTRSGAIQREKELKSGQGREWLKEHILDQ